MKNRMTRYLALALIVAGSTSAMAFPRETGGQHVPMSTEYTCFNRAQLTDAPAVAIMVDKLGHYREVTISSRGISYAYGLTAEGSDESGTYLTGQNLEVLISPDATKATVTLKGLGLIYQCKRKNP